MEETVFQMNGWIRSIHHVLAENQFIEQRQRARAKYCPEMTYGRHFAPPGPTARSAAVMIVIEVPEPNSHWSQCTIPLTVRPLHLADHPGQISFPGGRLKSSESFLEAARRELKEELGLDCHPDSVLGALSPMWVFNSNYRLQPFVAVQSGTVPYNPCVREVARVIRFPVAALVGEQEIQHRSFSRGQVHWKAGVYCIDDDYVWGATAIVLAELAEILRSLNRQA